MADKIEICATRIKNTLAQKNGKPMPIKQLYSAVKGKKISETEFKTALRQLIKKGVVFEKKGGFCISARYGYFSATVDRVNKTFGFIKPLEEGAEDIFVAGKYLNGAMPGDTVLANYVKTRGDSPEAEIITIVKMGASEFSGTVERKGSSICVRPDKLCKDLILCNECAEDVKDGDKVLAKVIRRGEKHSDHRCKITMVFGDSVKASSSAASILYMNDIETEFPLAVIDEARYCEHMGVPKKEFDNRLDLRDEIIFTIDGADTKDIDDAVSISRTENGYKLGVHIADVSYYVKEGSALDNDAFTRGTSIYYANKVVPMLPQELSNGICSLNPNVDRLAFSCIMNIDKSGKTLDFSFEKSVIKSRVKGVYSEVNEILEKWDDVSGDIAEKYSGLFDSIKLMKELADILNKNKISRGAPQIETAEPKLIIDENDTCIDVKNRARGKAEIIIEEFMLKANECAARLAIESGIPFVYRVHESPSKDRIEELCDIASMLNIPIPEHSKIKPFHLAKLLESAKGMDIYPVINNMVLRSMAKAKYSDVPLGHFGLVLEDYAHFTSPIRRYPDLAIHRILTELCYNKTSTKMIKKRFEDFARISSEQSSQCELVALRVERDCCDCYMAEYMSRYIGEKFEGMICSIIDYGMYVQLDNSIEGLVKIDTLPRGTYDFDGYFTLFQSGKKLYTVGQRVMVECVKADVSSGKIDFILV